MDELKRREIEIAEKEVGLSQKYSKLDEYKQANEDSLKFIKTLSYQVTEKE